MGLTADRSRAVFYRAQDVKGVSYICELKEYSEKGGGLKTGRWDGESRLW